MTASPLGTPLPDADYAQRTYAEYGFGRYVEAISTAAYLGFESVGFEIEEYRIKNLLRTCSQPNIAGICEKADQTRKFEFVDVGLWSNLDPFYNWLPWEMLTAHINKGGYLIVTREPYTLPQISPERHDRRWKLLDRRDSLLIPGFLKTLRTDIWQRQI